MPLYLGLDIGGTKSAAVVGDEHGMVLARVSARTPQGSWQEAVEMLCGLARDACHQHGAAVTDMAALGVSCGGPLDTKMGIVYAPPNLPAWDAVPLRDILTANLGLPVWLENDASATALAEHRWGAGRAAMTWRS